MTVYPVKKPRRKSKTPVRGVARKARVRPSNPARRAREMLRAYGPVERRAWIKSRCCIVLFCATNKPIENAHVRGDGAGRKADAKWVVPMCSTHHRQLHTLGLLTFERAYTVCLTTGAASTEIAWQSHIAERTA